MQDRRSLNYKSTTPVKAWVSIGPKLGVSGIRKMLGIKKRPLSLHIIKPKMGMTPEQTAEQVYKTARFVLSGYSGVKRTGYKGWHTLDIFPYREDGLRAVEESIAWIKSLYELLNRIDHQRIEKIIEEGDATQASGLLRTSILSLGQNP